VFTRIQLAGLRVMKEPAAPQTRLVYIHLHLLFEFPLEIVQRQRVTAVGERVKENDPTRQGSGPWRTASPEG
jgi:hypothetical protein